MQTMSSELMETSLVTLFDKIAHLPITDIIHVISIITHYIKWLSSLVLGETEYKFSPSVIIFTVPTVT